MKLIYIVIPLLFFNSACQTHEESAAVRYNTVVAGRCSADTLNTYHLVLPLKQVGTLPLLLILDSGGDGLLAVNKAEPAASFIPCIIIGSDVIRNNYPYYEQAIDMLIKEACAKYNANPQLIYLAGFSGGARMALEFAQMHTVKGVLMCGAGPTTDLLQRLPCPVYMISGTTDFNFSETYYNPLKMEGRRPYITDYFRGTHEWPPEENLKEGLLFLISGSSSTDRKRLEMESDKLSAKADSFMQDNDALFALKSVEKSLAFNPKNKRAKKQQEAFRKNNNIIHGMERLETYMDQEGRISQAYAKASMEKDSVWWFRELEELSREIERNTGDKKDHFMRIKGFLGILFYSRLNELIRGQSGNDRIIHLLAAYKMAEPENPDVYYDYALFAAKQNKEQVARKYLIRASTLGFKDVKKLNADFPPGIANVLLSQEKK